MKSSVFVRSLLAITAVSASAYSQIFIFNDPTAWITQRTTDVIVKAQLDTAQISQKKVTLALSVMKNGKKRPVGSKTFTVNDVSQEFRLGAVTDDIMGGFDYYRIDWSIPGAKDKGDCWPVGVINLPKMPAIVAYNAKKAGAELDAKAMAASLADADYLTVGTASFSVVWNQKNVVFAVKKTTGTDTAASVSFVFDGKNGKNAFASYPDRLIRCYAARDSISTMHFERLVKADTLMYREKEWKTDITKMVDGEKILITIPWHDLAVIPFGGRRVGFAAFAEVKSGTVKAGALPKTAVCEIPGTWGDLVFTE